MIKKTFKILGMHCSSCAMTIEWNLEDLGAKAKCSYPKSEVEVEYDLAKINEFQIKQAIKQSGYKVG